MDYASKLLYEAVKLDALLEAFEYRYLRYVDIGSDDKQERSQATAAFYGIRDAVVEVSEIAKNIGGDIGLAIKEYDEDN